MSAETLMRLDRVVADLWRAMYAQNPTEMLIAVSLAYAGAREVRRMVADETGTEPAPAQAEGRT